MGPVAEIATAVAGTAGGGLVIAGAAALLRIGRKLDAISDVVVGMPADPVRGRLEAVPSVAERLAALEHTQAAREQMTARLAGLEAWRDEHVRTCGVRT